MIGRVAMLGDYAEKPRIRAFEYACQEAGFLVERVAPATTARPGNFDFAFTSGRHRPEREAFARFHCDGKPVVVLDLGYLNRASAKDQGGYHQVGLNRIGWLPESEVPSDRFDALNLEVLPRSRQSGHLLILGQVPGDSQHPFASPRQMQWWLACQMKGIKRFHPDLSTKIVYRPHPLAKSDQRLEDFNQDWEWQSPTSTALAVAVKEAKAILTYNSTAGLEAIRQGVPVICAQEAHYSAVASANRQRRLSYFHRLAYAQWTLEEITEGLALRFLLKTQFEMP